MAERARWTLASRDAKAQPRVSSIAFIVSGVSRFSAEQVYAALTSSFGRDLEFQIQVANSSSDATAAASHAAASASIVVAVGGDGTVADVATGIFGSSAALAIIPAGSTNIAARSLDIPTDPAAALALICGSNQRRSIDVGRSDDRSFVHMAGAGVDAALFHATSPDPEAPGRLVCLCPCGRGRASATAVRCPHCGRWSDS